LGSQSIEHGTDGALMMRSRLPAASTARISPATQLLLEPKEGDVAAALQTVAAIEAVLDEAQAKAPRLLHGFDITAWPLLDAALARGYDTRIGLEDVLLLPDGAPARGNAHLVAVAWEQARRAGRN